MVFSLGVLHHTPDPAEAFAQDLRRAKAGAEVGVWVYNEIIRTLMNVVRAVTVKLPSVVSDWIAYVITRPEELAYASCLRFFKLNRYARYLIYFNKFLSCLDRQFDPPDPGSCHHYLLSIQSEFTS